MASVTVKLGVVFVAHLAVRTAAEDGLKSVGKIKCVMETTVQSPLEIKSSLKGGLEETAGLYKAGLQGPLWPLSALKEKALALERKEGAFTCTLAHNDDKKLIASISGEREISGAKVKGTMSSPAQWPMEPSASISGDKKVGGATVKAALSSPATWPMVPKASVSAERDFGPLSCTVKSASLPLKNSEVGTVTVKETIKEFECSLVGAITAKDGKVTVENGKFKAKRSVDTPIGPVCGVLETKVNEPNKPTATFSWKKTVGKVCCNVEATSKGAIKCTFDSDATHTYNKKAETNAAPKKGLFGSEVAPDGSTTSLVIALIGFAIGGIITFIIFGQRREALATGEQHLLA